MKFITDEVIKLLNFRIQQEVYSSYIYSQMSQWLQNASFLKSAAVWQKFSNEELEHAQLAKDYLLSFNIMPELMPIEEPANVFECIDDIIKATFDHEVLVTQQCLDLTNKAMELKDWTLFALGQKYNEIQRVEMDEAYNLVDISKLTTDKLILDNYISENF